LSFFFNSKETTLSKIVDYIGPYKSLVFSFVKLLGTNDWNLGKTNLKEVAEYTLPLSTTNPKESNLLVP
jgi:hypothetical protein